jgi:hypothetical protein
MERFLMHYIQRSLGHQEVGPFIVQNGPAELVHTKVGVAQVVIEISVFVA